MACKDVSSPVDNDTFKDLEVQVCFKTHFKILSATEVD
jgi:hypothetical protein